ncbi:MAG: NAD(P)H nitroreductase [Vulcanimicrobiaceae bacterium]
MDAIEAIATRRSIGKLTGDVSDAEVRDLVALALCAPNHKLTAPWRFTVLRGEARLRLGRLLAELAATVPLPSGVEREAYLAKEMRKPTRAPVLLVITTRTDADPVVAAEDFAATAAATQNVLLAAHARGLGAIWRTGEMAYRPEIKAFLGLDPADRIVAVVYVGRPAMDAPSARERDVDAVLRVLT